MAVVRAAAKTMLPFNLLIVISMEDEDFCMVVFFGVYGIHGFFRHFHCMGTF